MTTVAQRRRSFRSDTNGMATGWLTEKAAKPQREFRRGLNFALPNDYRAPALFPQLLKNLSVTSYIFCDFSFPESRVRFRLLTSMFAAVLVPEATMNKYYL